MSFLYAELVEGPLAEDHERELGTINASLEYLRCGINRLENGLRINGEAFKSRLDEHEKEEREFRKQVWAKIDKLSNLIIWAGGILTGAYALAKFFFKL